MQTQHIRVGHGIVVCVPEFNHPIRIAERAAVLDILSGGRLEFGTGRSATWTELGGFRANPDTTKKSWDEFVHRIQHCNPVGKFVNNQVSTINFLYCHEHDETGSRIGLQMGRYFNYLANQLDMAKEVFPTKSYPTAGLLPSLRRQTVAPGEENKPPEGLTTGNPARLIKVLKNWEACGIDRVNFVLNAAEMLPQEQVLNSLRLFATEVMPAFVERQPTKVAAGGGR